MHGVGNEPPSKKGARMDRIVKVQNYQFLIKESKEHQQKYWVNGMFYESHGGGLLAYMGRHKGKYRHKRVLDIGASIGNHAVFFAGVLGMEVVAIEPVKSSYDHMMENMRLNNLHVWGINCALGAETKQITMENVSKNKYNAGMYQVREGEDTAMRRLDDLDIGEFGVVKIDVEHYNEPLLIGGAEFFKAQRNIEVFIECETPIILKKTNRIMSKYGYKRDKTVKVNHTPTYLWKK